MIKTLNQLRISSFYLMIALASSQTLANSGTELATYDLGSNQEIRISSRKTIGLKITLNGLVPNHPVWMEVSLSPANHSDNPSDKDISRKLTENIQVVPSDTLILNRKVKLLDIRKHRFERDLSQTWNIQLNWVQPSTLHSGNAFRTIQFIEKKVKRLYTLTGPMICAWETPTDLDSQLYFNPDQDRMEISRQSSIHPGISTFSGLDGAVQDHYSLEFPYLVPPVNISKTGPFGWFYAARQKISQTDTVKKIIQKWILSRGQSGVFGQRLSFQRFPALEYQKISTGHSSSWEITQKGLIDLGATSNEFIIIPDELSNELTRDPSKIAQFLGDKRPRLNTCDTNLPSEEMIQTRSKVGDEGLVYFYPENGES